MPYQVMALDYQWEQWWLQIYTWYFQLCTAIKDDVFISVEQAKEIRAIYPGNSDADNIAYGAEHAKTR